MESKVYLDNVPFVVWNETEEYKKVEGLHFTNMRDADASLALMINKKMSHIGFKWTARVEDNNEILRHADLIAGINISKPGIKYKICVHNSLALVEGISTGEPIMFGDIYCAEDNNEVSIKNCFPYVSIMYSLLNIEVSEPTDVDIYYMFLDNSIRKALVCLPNNLELCGEKYKIKSSNVSRITS